MRWVTALHREGACPDIITLVVEDPISMDKVYIFERVSCPKWSPIGQNQAANSIK
jgi:hypothetical protein